MRLFRSQQITIGRLMKLVRLLRSMIDSVGESSVQHHREIDVNLSGDTVELPDYDITHCDTGYDIPLGLSHGYL